MCYKSSAIFAALAATVICSAPVAQAATITPGADPTAVTINLNNTAGPTTNWTGSIPQGDPFAGDVINFSSSQPVTVTSGSTITPVSTATPTNITIDAGSAVPVGLQFTDVVFSTNFGGSGNPRPFTVMGTAANGTLTSTMGTVANGSLTTTFSLTPTDVPLTSAVLMPGPGSNSYTFTNVGLSGLSVVPLPASLPLFASGLAGVGLLGWRRKRKSTTSILAA